MNNDLLKIIRGSSDTIEVSYYDEDNKAPVNLTGGTVYFTAKKKLSDADNAPDTIKKDVTSHSNPTAGESVIALVPADTEGKKLGPYIYDVKLVTADGKHIPSKQLKMELVQEVTERP